MESSLLQKVTHEGRWRSVAEHTIRLGQFSLAHSDDFGTYWIEAGHRLREQISDDVLLIRFLRLALPPYIGTGMALYRGENLSRWKAGAIGLAWSARIDVARMFASGLNSFDSGGVLLTAIFPSVAIVSGPNSHSKYLGEDQFTVDPRHAENMQVLEHFPPS